MMTVRQVFYRLVRLGLAPTRRAYRALCEWVEARKNDPPERWISP